MFVALPVGASPALGTRHPVRFPPATLFAPAAPLVCVRASPRDLPRIAEIEEWSFGA